MPSSKVPTTRRQASLYLLGAPEIEEVRWRFNETQARLIPAHVTLCREDEVHDWNLFQDRVRATLPIHVTIDFGIPVREKNLVYVPAVGSTLEFDALRCRLLASERSEPRKHAPHITLIHPRNGICTEEIFQEIVEHIRPFSASFRAISLIEQEEGGIWKYFAQV